jgi:hypothetical protein
MLRPFQQDLYSLALILVASTGALFVVGAAIGLHFAAGGGEERTPERVRSVLGSCNRALLIVGNDKWILGKRLVSRDGAPPLTAIQANSERAVWRAVCPLGQARFSPRMTSDMGGYRPSPNPMPRA